MKIVIKSPAGLKKPCTVNETVDETFCGVGVSGYLECWTPLFYRYGIQLREGMF